MTNTTITNCITSCVSTFGIPESETKGQNKVCLTTAALGTFILISGLADLYRIGNHLKNRKWSLLGNGALLLCALIKIGAGASLLGNAFFYEPYSWDTQLLSRCQKFCYETYNPPTPQPQHTLYPNYCCNDCKSSLKPISNTANFGLGTTWAVILGCTSSAKLIYNCITRIHDCCVQRSRNSALIDLPVREWKWAKTHLGHDLLESIYTVSIIVLVTGNTLANDENIFEFENDSSWMRSDATQIVDNKCLNFCNDLGLFNIRYWC